jgi:hypothetical protein
MTNTNPLELELGDTVQPLTRGTVLPRDYGSAISVVININATTITVVTLYDIAHNGPARAQRRYFPHGTYRLTARRDDRRVGAVDEELAAGLYAAELPLEYADRPVVVVPCSAGKSSTPAPAAELYTGSYHAAARRAAAAITTPDRILILSARYGLLRLDDPAPLEPYELTIGQPGAITAATVDLGPLAAYGPAPTVTVLAGARYADVLADAGVDVVRPLRTTRGIGEQLHILKELAS